MPMSNGRCAAVRTEGTGDKYSPGREKSSRRLRSKSGKSQADEGSFAGQLGLTRFKEYAIGWKLV